jgi:hypothetical protein
LPVVLSTEVLPTAWEYLKEPVGREYQLTRTRVGRDIFGHTISIRSKNNRMRDFAILHRG